ncbi:hypothetical protein [Diplocloster modestus]|uniref:Uncharacterized protein n=1 Tax=Diplocloster modestus TaxID=2850322 RepID=A0ABS6KBL2_9FIRM|nr:hypothetical protein [Diplocloster modestus]MBU9727900.1 hypothetical protein [Diplocloster modestus]
MKKGDKGQDKTYREVLDATKKLNREEEKHDLKKNMSMEEKVFLLHSGSENIKESFIKMIESEEWTPDEGEYPEPEIMEQMLSELPEFFIIKGRTARTWEQVLTDYNKNSMMKLCSLLDAEVKSGWNKTRLAASVVQTLTQTPMTWIGLYNEETVHLFEEIMDLETGQMIEVFGKELELERLVLSGLIDLSYDAVTHSIRVMVPVHVREAFHKTFYGTANQKLIVKLNNWEEITSGACSLYGMVEIEHLLAIFRAAGEKMPVDQWANFIKDRFILWEELYMFEKSDQFFVSLIPEEKCGDILTQRAKYPNLDYRNFTLEEIQDMYWDEYLPEQEYYQEMEECFCINLDMPEEMAESLTYHCVNLAMAGGSIREIMEMMEVMAGIGKDDEREIVKRLVTDLRKKVPQFGLKGHSLEEVRGGYTVI